MATQINFKLLSEKAASKLKVGLYRHKGDAFPGLHLNVGKTRKTWYLRKRINGKMSSIKLGAFHDMSASDAFERAGTGEKVASSDIRTVRDGWGKWVETSMAVKNTSSKHLDRMTRQLEMHAKHIMDANVADVTSAQIQSLLNRITNDGKIATARAVRIGLGNSFHFAPVPNPVNGKQTLVASSAPVTPAWHLYAEAHGVDEDDWSTIWEAIMQRREQNVIVGTAVAIMFLTGIRSDNVRSLSWDQVDLQNKTIRLTKMKNGLARTLPVMDTVIELLMAIRSRGSDFVFPAKTGAGYISNPKGTFAVINGEKVCVFQPHDGRRHFMQAIAEAFLPEYVAHFLRGDAKGGKGNDMLMKYLKRMGNRRAVEDIEKVIIERIKVTPYFEY